MSERILIDRGHGGSDPGAVGYAREVDITHAWGDELADCINILGGDVYVLKDGADGNSDLSVPVNEANAYGKPWLFVSLHANAGKGTGAEIYLYSGAWNHQGTADLAHSLFNAYMEVASTYGLTSRGVKPADFYVLRETRNRAVLLELGFVDNYEDAELLKNSIFRKKACQTMAKALMLTAGQKIIEEDKPPVAPDPQGILSLPIGKYLFISAENGKALAGRNNGEACIWQVHGGDDQFWNWNGNCLINVKHNKVLTLDAGDDYRDYLECTIKDYQNKEYQQVYFYRGGAILFKHSHKALDVLNHKEDNGARVGQYSLHGKPNQVWIPIKLA